MGMLIAHNVSPTAWHHVLAASTDLIEKCNHELFSEELWRNDEAPVRIRAIQPHSSLPYVKPELLTQFNVSHGFNDVLYFVG